MCLFVCFLLLAQHGVEGYRLSQAWVLGLAYCTKELLSSFYFWNVLQVIQARLTSFSPRSLILLTSAAVDSIPSCPLPGLTLSRGSRSKHTLRWLSLCRVGSTTLRRVDVICQCRFFLLLPLSSPWNSRVLGTGLGHFDPVLELIFTPKY